MKSLARPGDAEEILERLRKVRPESTRRWGRMSAHQMVCHLADAFRVATGERPSSDRSSLAFRTIGKWVALYVPLRWPTAIPTTPELDQSAGRGTPPGDFATDVARVEGLVAAFTAESIDLGRQRHPLFGTMSHAAWLRWGYLHMDHHLRQFGA